MGWLESIGERDVMNANKCFSSMGKIVSSSVITLSEVSKFVVSVQENALKSICERRFENGEEM